MNGIRRLLARIRGSEGAPDIEAPVAPAMASAGARMSSPHGMVCFTVVIRLSEPKTSTVTVETQNVRIVRKPTVAAVRWRRVSINVPLRGTSRLVRVARGTGFEVVDHA